MFSLNQEDYAGLKKARGGEIISCNTILNPTNEIDIFELILQGIKEYQFLMDEI